MPILILFKNYSKNCNTSSLNLSNNQIIIQSKTNKKYIIDYSDIEEVKLILQLHHRKDEFLGRSRWMPFSSFGFLILYASNKKFVVNKDHIIGSLNNFKKMKIDYIFFPYISKSILRSQKEIHERKTNKIKSKIYHFMKVHEKLSVVELQNNINKGKKYYDKEAIIAMELLLEKKHNISSN
ncbi:hypothetical protein FHS70_003313 [Flammeovirga yaeyamensis]|nr:hypothetical protein [Flammeovirga yaeyamensis]